MTFTPDQLAIAGFVKTVEHLPHVLACYEKGLPNGNTLTFSRPAQEKAKHLVTEFYLGQARKPVAVYIIENEQDFAETAVGEGKKVLMRAS